MGVSCCAEQSTQATSAGNQHGQGLTEIVHQGVLASCFQDFMPHQLLSIVHVLNNYLQRDPCQLAALSISCLPMKHSSLTVSQSWQCCNKQNQASLA